MSKFIGKYRIESNRLKEFDYTYSMWYYITICTKDKKKWFGDFVSNNFELNNIGKIVKSYWLEIPQHFQNVEVDNYVIMPNHLHGIILLNNSQNNQQKKPESRDVIYNVSTTKNNYFSNISPDKNSLSVVIRSFKAAVKRWCTKNNFNDFFWQTNYYDHIIRNDKDLYRIRKYIEFNPLKWEVDKLYTE